MTVAPQAIPVGVERPIVFLHSSDEHYGADRILLDLFDALPEPEQAHAEFWLPTDVQHGIAPLCRALEARGATVHHLDLPVLRRAYRTPRELIRLVRRGRKLYSTMRRRKPRFVYCTTSAVFLAAPIARAAGVPRVVGHVQELWSRSDSVVLGALARACHVLLTISVPVKKALPTRIGARAEVVLNATAAPTSYVPLRGRTTALSYVVASRWNGWKGHRTLLAAWDLLDSPGRLVVLGGPPPSGDAVDVPAMVRDLRHPETVEVVGEVADVEAYLEAADVMIVPSDAPEPFGLVAVEAFARGRPVVASRGGGLADIVTEGKDGWLFEPTDVASLAELLARLTREQVNEAGAAARESYEQKFTARRYAAQWREATGFSRR